VDLVPVVTTQSNGKRGLVQLGSDRRLASLEHVTHFSDATTLTANISATSDGTYFQDLGNSLSAASITHLERRVDLDWHDDTWRVLGRVQNFQTLDEAIARDDRPYERVPQLVAMGEWPALAFGLEPRVDTELVNFQRNDGVTGQRLDLLPQLTLPLGPQGLRFTMSEPFTLLLLDDARVIHETTPIQPEGGPGHRDTLVVTLRQGGFQGPR